MSINLFFLVEYKLSRELLDLLLHLGACAVKCSAGLRSVDGKFCVGCDRAM